MKCEHCGEKFLNDTNGEPLCSKCLDTIEKSVITGTGSPTLVEGEDYYYENELFVFTEKYHVKRGYCCNNNCRHCPWTN